jgi:hypothetical protein
LISFSFTNLFVFVNSVTPIFNDDLITTQSDDGLADIHVENNLAYIIGNHEFSSQFYVYNVSQFNNPQKIVASNRDDLLAIHENRQLFVNNSFVFLNQEYLSHLIGMYEYISIMNCTDLTNCSTISSKIFPTGTFEKFAVCGWYTFLLSYGSSGFFIYSFTDYIEEMEEVSNNYNFTTESYSIDFSVNDFVAYYLDYNGTSLLYNLKIIDYANITNPKLLGTWSTPSTLETVYIEGNYAFLKTDQEKILVLNITDLASPQFLSEIDLGYSINELIRQDDLLCILSTNKLDILDFSNPLIPVKIGEFNSSIDENFNSFYISNSYAYIIGTSQKNKNFLYIINLNDLDNPSYNKIPFPKGFLYWLQNLDLAIKVVFFTGISLAVLAIIIIPITLYFIYKKKRHSKQID